MAGDNDPMEQDDEELSETEDTKDDEPEDDFIVPTDESEEFVVPDENAKQRKAARSRDYNDTRREDAERERDDLRRELIEARRPRPQLPAVASPREAHDDRVKAAHKARTEIAQGHSAEQANLGTAQMSTERYNEWLEKSQKADDALDDARAARRESVRSVRNAGDDARRQLSARHPDVTENPTAMMLARGLYAVAIASRSSNGEGKNDNTETMDEVMNKVREQLHMGKHRHGGQEPTEADKRKHQGVPRGGGSPAKAKTGYKMTALERSMADVALEHIEDDKERYRVYAKGLTNDT